jgi:multidrug resistance efflux pump
MSIARLLAPSVLVLSLIGMASRSSAQDAPAPPAPPPPSTAPTTAPTTAPAPQPHTVAKGKLSLKVEAVGTFLPADPVEVRIRPEAYKGGFRIVSAAGHGAPVKKGDTLLQIDPADLDVELAGARNDLAAARAGLAKGEADAAIAVKSEALALRMAENSARKAAADLKWWDDLTGPQVLAQIDLGLRQQQAYVEDQEDELDQLKAMYKTEDLTGATADIVLKRAVRQYEISQINLKMQQEVSRKSKEYDQPNSRLPLEFAAEQAGYSLEGLRAAQALAKVTRETGLKSAQLGVAAAEKRVRELEGDLAQLTAVAPSDGVVLYGQLADGAVAPADPRTLRPGEKLAPGGTVMVLYAPGALRVGFDLPESKLAWVKAGMKAKVSPVAYPELSYEGVVAAIPVLGKSAGPEQAFPVSVDLAGVDPKIAPGLKVNVKIDAGEGEEVVLVPAGAVSDGKVRVRKKDGTEEPRDVVTGRADGQSVEVLKGLEAGEEVLLGGKP